MSNRLWSDEEIKRLKQDWFMGGWLVGIYSAALIIVIVQRFF